MIRLDTPWKDYAESNKHCWGCWLTDNFRRCQPLPCNCAQWQRNQPTSKLFMGYTAKTIPEDGDGAQSRCCLHQEGRMAWIYTGGLLVYTSRHRERAPPVQRQHIKVLAIFSTPHSPVTAWDPNLHRVTTRKVKKSRSSPHLHPCRIMQICPAVASYSVVSNRDQ